MKTFGLPVPAGKGSAFEKNVRRLLAGDPKLSAIVLPLLVTWHATRIQAAALGRQLVAEARQSDACQLLMSIPGVGAITATAFVTAIENPDNFRRSRSVGAWLGLTTRRYQSGEVDYNGHISRRGDRHVRGLLYEAATVILTRSQAESDLRTWGLKLKERVGFKRAAVALARKLAVIMHAMLRAGTMFERTARVAALQFTNSARASSAPRRPCRDVGRAIPIDGLHRLGQLNASSTLEGSSCEDRNRCFLPTFQRPA